MIEFIILLILIFINGLFVMSEIALVSARKARLEAQAEKGDARARHALDLAENPQVFLPTAQIGITLVAILTGVYIGEKFNGYLQPYIERIVLLKPYAEDISTTIIVVLTTFLTIVFGELIPKRIGMLKAEKIAKLVALPMRWLSKATFPLVWLLNKTSNLFFTLFNISSSRDNSVTEEEIKAIINEGTEQGTIAEAEQEIIERVFHLGDRNITSIMTHRSDIIFFDLDESEEMMKDKISQEPHSVYPICDKQIDDIMGIISIKDLYVTDDSLRFRDIMKPALFVPENNTAYQVLEKFKESKMHSCFVVDEYGSLLGMITINDILEAIVGELPEPDLVDYEIVKRSDGSFLIDGQIPFYDFLNYFQKIVWMNEGEQQFDTLAGFILHQIEKIPREGEKFEWRGFNFEIMDMDGHRIDKILVTLSDELKMGLQT